MNNEQNVYQPRRKRAADFRRIARRALKGFWWLAAGVSFLAAILGGLPWGGISLGGSFDFNLSGLNNPDYLDPDVGFSYIPVLTPEEAETFESALSELDFQAMGKIFEGDYPILAMVLSSFVIITVLTAVVLFLLQMFVSSPIKVGYQKFCLNVLDGKREETTLDTLFDYFGCGYLKTVGLNFCHSFILGLTNIPTYIGLLIGGAQFLGTLPTILVSETPAAVLISYLTFMGWVSLGSIVTMCIHIPVSYAYSMAHIIMADYPGVGPIEALRISRQMMRGNKWRMFCLDFSFIGWQLLSICCTCTLGMLFVLPFQNVARAAFYHEISNRHTPEDVEFSSVNSADYYID